MGEAWDRNLVINKRNLIYDIQWTLKYMWNYLPKVSMLPWHQVYIIHISSAKGGRPHLPLGALRLLWWYKEKIILIQDILTSLYKRISPAVASKSLMTFSSLTIANTWSSTTLARFRNTVALSDSVSGKKPKTITPLLLITSFACSVDVIMMAGGPVFFLSQATISSACRPPI